MLVKVRAIIGNTVVEWFELSPNQDELTLAKMAIEARNYCISCGWRFIDFRGLTNTEEAIERKLMRLYRRKIGRPPMPPKKATSQRWFWLSAVLALWLTALAAWWSLCK